MRTRLLLAAVVVVILSVGAGVARADQPPLDLAGQPFYFSATCTGIGDVILFNQSLARTSALVIVGSPGVVVEPFSGRGIERAANAECTITGGGETIETIEPFDEPFSFPALIVGRRR
jgi:hypothetical protein